MHKKTQDRTSGSVVTNPLLDFRNRVIKAHINNPKGAKILDIGFGMCSNLRNLKAMGFEVFGLDPDSEACEMAKKEFGNDSIYSGTLDNSKLEIADFDLITLYDVIEHPLSPMTLMKNALSRLKKDGLLAIFTPNMPDIKSNKLVQFQIDLEHLQYLTPQTIAFIAKEFNLNIIHLECSGFPVIPDIHNNGIKLKKSIIHAAKGFVRNLPFFIRFNRIRHQLFNSIPDNRLGNYNIFAILQKQ
ncbi:MAG: class I SAM-dependent methyltransferase [Fibrobacteres bacterium]|nr:class I SAM-dependent methyltransferase [Fibrobacterota bacterium]